MSRAKRYNATTGEWDYVETVAPGGSGTKPYLSLERKSRYLYDVTFQSEPNDLGLDIIPSGACSSYVQNGKLYRNLDLPYNNNASFHVILPGMEGTAFIDGLTDSNLNDDLISQLPYHMVDGKNEYGIMVSTHVLYNDWEFVADGEIALTKLPYVVLKNVKSMSTIATDLADILDNIYTSESLLASGYLIQILVTDGVTSYVLSPDTENNGAYIAIDISANPKLANFYWVSSSTVVRTDLQNRPTGVERWNMMPCSLKELRFTKCYEEPTRLSEFIGESGTTKDSTDAELTEIYNTAHDLYLARTRNGETWQTMHSVVYSAKGMEHLWIQEDWEKDFIASTSDGGSGGLLPVIYVSTESGATVTATKGSVSVTAEHADNHYILKVPDFGTWTVSAEKDGKHNEVSVTVDVVKEYSVSILIGFIYGVEWDKSASTKLSRTDDAVLFTDPVPYLSGMAEGDYSSPFDGLSPWKDISIEEDPTVGTLVKIPKFWYRITSSVSKLKFQIANFPAEGFSVSPGHMDRGDGKRERDYIYVGRYHCSANDYKSVTGVKPKVSITRATARTAIHNLKSDTWQLDYATWWTINLLYLVEFADWDCQKTIGYGRGNGSAVENMGYTDAMPYHTGSTKASKTTYGVSTQYRYMEGLWDNCLDWCDGITFSGTNVFACLNPSNFADNTTNFTQVGTRPTDSNVIKDWSIPSAEGYEWCLYPSVIGGTNMEEYCADKCSYNASGVVLSVGGYYSQNLSCGLFYRYGDYAASYSNAGIGARLQRLP